MVEFCASMLPSPVEMLPFPAVELCEGPRVGFCEKELMVLVMRGREAAVEASASSRSFMLWGEEEGAVR